MLFEDIVRLFETQNFEEMNKLVEDIPTAELAAEMAKIDRQILPAIFCKLESQTSAKIFVLFSKELQRYLLESLSKIEFEPIAEELLLGEAEKTIDKEIFKEILLKAEHNSRQEKLLEIIDKIDNKRFTALKPVLSEMPAADIADIINDIDEDKVAVLYRLLPKDLASEAFVEMDSERQEILLRAFTDRELASTIDNLFVDDTLDIIEEMPSNLVIRILKLASPETRDMINKLLGFPKDSAGSIMTTECITLREKMTTEEAIKKVRKQAKDKETIYTLYVTDDKKHLLGIVSAEQLLLHEPKDRIGDFMQEDYIFAHTHTDKEEVSNLLSKYDLLAIPIVDSENRINGIVTVDDAMDVMQEEVSEDISKMAAITPNSTPYLKRSVFSIFKSRVPWLLLLLISATFTGLIINKYENTLNHLSTLLFACIPMLMDSGGNAGSQASVTIIRSLALDEVEFKDTLKVLFKEIRVAIMLALVLSIACFAKLQLIDNLLFGYNYTIIISLVVSLALFITICVAKIIGAFLPLLAKKCHLDPAVVASPFITTIVDAISLMVFCSLSVALLG